MPGDFPKVIGVSEFSLEHAQSVGSESDSGEQARAFAAIEIEDRDRFACLVAQLARDEQGAEVIARENIPLARSDEDPRAFRDRP